ncbi:adenylate/guanylate cyclase domain-containing protein [Sulfitobacter sp. D35]|uniref:CHASE2 domain-containing protein n=1 Tax=Sulfitobacter sp. D35 TaxID=3083252 RepID=UPI00296E97E5|nr:adenylate/guanylate cyclase domain-containing protein [Sulfitobacter sp. D35]MDW4496599.1 adenylate/guanylate cyclase domain-containing protein [Sulfitobacter sp. D35]
MSKNFKVRLSTWVGWVRVVAFIGLVFGLIIRIGDPLPLSALRNFAFDLFHQSKPRDFATLPVAIIDLDDRSIEEIGQWPWPRTRFAEIVEKATAAGAVAIAFDVIFSEPDRLSPPQVAADNPELPPAVSATLRQMPDNDEILAAAFRKSRVIVGQTSVRTAAGNLAEKRQMEAVPHALIGPDPRPFLLHFPDVVQNLPVLEAAAAGRGMFSARPDRDGIYRRAPVVMMVQDHIRLSLTAELLRVATGGEPFAVRSSEAGVEGVVVARQLVPTASDGTVWPYLTPSSQARYVRAADLLKDRIPPDRLTGHLVLVGTSAIGLEDFRATPLGVSMAGVEIHAQILENMLSNSALVRPNFTIAVELVTTFVLCLLVIIFAPMLTARTLILTAGVLLTGYVGTSYYLFWNNRILLDPTYPVLSTFIAFLLISTVNYLREERQRRQIRSAFGQYVSPDLVEQLSEDGAEVTLGGETRDLTLLFSDVRGFTAIAEDFKDDPEALTRLMNEFLTILCRAILDNNGTIDKFMGDAVMAFWNAPLDNPDHVRAACRSALRMIEDVDAFNERRAALAAAHQLAAGDAPVAPSEKMHRINVGIGINSGPCVVGNMGSDTRFDYTALGDPVNVASRLEGQSRYYGAAIILGSSTAGEVRDEMALMELDMIRVVGKALPENIFALLGDAAMRNTPAFQECFDLNGEMLQAYRAQEWDRAEQLIDELEARFATLEIGLAGYLDLYRARMSELRRTPPGPGWDGIYASTSK